MHVAGPEERDMLYVLRVQDVRLERIRWDDGDFVLVFELVPQATAAPNPVFQAHLVASGYAGSVYAKTDSGSSVGQCAAVVLGLGTTFDTPFVYRPEVTVAP